MTDYNGKEQRWSGVEQRKERWHMKKEVPIATIATVLFAIGAGTLWMFQLRSDIDLHWQAFNQHVETESDRLSETRLQNTRVLEALKEMRKDIVLIKVALASHTK